MMKKTRRSILSVQLGAPMQEVEPKGEIYE
jgi:hypothetical protein